MAIATGFYKDESVQLKDLLEPSQSKLFKTDKFITLKKNSKLTIKEGKFASKFKEELLSQNARVASFEYFTEDGISIYFPYSENFYQNNAPITVGEAMSDRDYIMAMHPLCTQDESSSNYCSQEVRVDDNYAELNPVHIVNTGAVLSTGSMASGPEINKVFIGWVRCRAQFDKFISFNSANGGGSELKFVRADGYLKYEGEQVTSPQGVISIGNEGRDYITRKEIRKGTWIRVYALWDSNWEADNTEQVLGIYEEDATGEQKFDGSLTTTVKLKTPLEASAERKIGFSFTVKSQDQIIRQLIYKRSFLFADGKNDQGHGFHDGWPIYDGNSSVSWTLPFVQVQ